MGILLTFLLGIANFTAQRAVFDSGHPMLARLSRATLRNGRVASLGMEFVLLVSALFAASEGLYGWIWLYGGYSLLNGVAAWMIAARRV